MGGVPRGERVCHEALDWTQNASSLAILLVELPETERPNQSYHSTQTARKVSAY